MAASTAALDVCSRAISSFDGYGIYGVEMFLLEDDTVLLNEIAPRPHNSGHYTMEACANDQFELHIRAVMGLPLASCEMVVGAAVMLNILGEDTMEATKAPLEKVGRRGVGWGGGVLSKTDVGTVPKIARTTTTNHLTRPLLPLNRQSASIVAHDPERRHSLVREGGGTEGAQDGACYVRRSVDAGAADVPRPVGH